MGRHNDASSTPRVEGIRTILLPEGYEIAPTGSSLLRDLSAAQKVRENELDSLGYTKETIGAVLQNFLLRKATSILAQDTHLAVMSAAAAPFICEIVETYLESKGLRGQEDGAPFEKFVAGVRDALRRSSNALEAESVNPSPALMPAQEAALRDADLVIFGGNAQNAQFIRTNPLLLMSAHSFVCEQLKGQLGETNLKILETAVATDRRQRRTQAQGN